VLSFSCELIPFEGLKGSPAFLESQYEPAFKRCCKVYFTAKKRHFVMEIGMLYSFFGFMFAWLRCSLRDVKVNFIAVVESKRYFMTHSAS
jgi:hypothetical protein